MSFVSFVQKIKSVGQELEEAIIRADRCAGLEKPPPSPVPHCSVHIGENGDLFKDIVEKFL